jgi:diguanylate cyclase (GGDEF)-like protein
MQAPETRRNLASALRDKILSPFKSSIRARLTLFTAVFVAIVIGLAMGAIISLKSADRMTEELDQKWLTGTAMLGELSDRISEFRIAETYRGLATDAKMVAYAEVLADEHRDVIEKVQNEYATLVGGDIPVATGDSARAAWNAYHAAHDAWVAADTNGTHEDPTHYAATSHQLYKAADAAVDRMVDENTTAAHAEAAAVDRLADRSITIAIAVSAAAIVFAIWLLFRLRSQITRPLGAITQALSQLAAGDRDIRVPELNRPDEIGQMAKAFDVFRANALALEQAHEATRAAQEEAQAQARHDALTGLPNRRVFSAELETALDRTRSGASTYSVLLIDLDRFKGVNDLQGHPVGDMVLCEVARRLQEIVRKNDTVVRLGGDEFAVITEGDAQPQAHLDRAMQLARRIIGTIREPILIGDSRIEIGASIGIASCRTGDNDADALLHEADIAMYRAKRDGRGTFRFFEQSMDEELREQAALETDLKKAVAEGKIRPYYQPLVDIGDNRICGFELLSRWEHPERGFVPPDVFIPLAEHLGMIPDLTSSILRQACRDAGQWPEDIRLSVNISPSQLKDPLLPTWLLAILVQEGFNPARLEIEITETALVSDIKTAKTILTHLQSLGITVALDDFGTGYSSLYHLRELKFDKVKIDKSFVQAMLDNGESEKIVDAILSLAKNLHLPTVAEGIEDPAVLRHLAERGCEYGQGYYFGKAMTADHVREILENRKAA